MVMPTDSLHCATQSMTTNCIAAKILGAPMHVPQSILLKEKTAKPKLYESKTMQSSHQFNRC
jgi:hypothetical protein